MGQPARQAVALALRRLCGEFLDEENVTREHWRAWAAQAAKPRLTLHLAEADAMLREEAAAVRKTWLCCSVMM